LIYLNHIFEDDRNTTHALSVNAGTSLSNNNSNEYKVVTTNMTRSDTSNKIINKQLEISGDSPGKYDDT